nr:MAG TPA: hypothetical protein [Caudoviricetes sp.]DAT69729.1 MAG TPA: hypothetical protein [Caudoviricetes sp.]
MANWVRSTMYVCGKKKAVLNFLLKRKIDGGY